MQRWYLVGGFIAVASHPLAAQTVSRPDSAAVADALARDILVQPDVPFGGALLHLVVDIAVGTMAARVGMAVRRHAPDKWLAPSDAAAATAVVFTIGPLFLPGDSLQVTDTWSLCRAGNAHGNGQTVRYILVRTPNDWQVVNRQPILVGNPSCSPGGKRPR